MSELEARFADGHDAAAAPAMVENDRKQPGLPDHLGMSITAHGPGRPKKT